jgi:hypothetical protein
MMIYQVLDEQHHMLGEFNNLDFALENAEMMMELNFERYFYVKEVEIVDA